MARKVLHLAKMKASIFVCAVLAFVALGDGGSLKVKNPTWNGIVVKTGPIMLFPPFPKPGDDLYSVWENLQQIIEDTIPLPHGSDSFIVCLVWNENYYVAGRFLYRVLLADNSFKYAYILHAEVFEDDWSAYYDRMAFDDSPLPSKSKVIPKLGVNSGHTIKVRHL